MKDVIIIGAGVIGSFIARNLAKYNLDVLVIEKNNDVGDGTSCANSAIVHSGYDPHAGTLKAKYNALGNSMFPAICKELDVEFDNIGSITVANNEEELNTLKELQANSDLNGVKTILLNQEELRKEEPFVTKNAIAGLLAPTAGIINPFELVVALMENAMDNGVKLNLNEEVTNVENLGDHFKVTTSKNTYEAKVVINAAGLYSDKIHNMATGENEKVTARKGEYYVLDHFAEKYVSHTLFSVPSSKGKGILVSPTTHGNYLLGPTSEFVDDKTNLSVDNDALNVIKSEVKRLVDNVPMQYVIREFSGNRAYHDSNDFVIRNYENGFISLLGIQSPGLASSPAISADVAKMVIDYLNPSVNDSFNPIRRPLYRVNKLTPEERNELIKQNPDFGKIVCRCEGVTLGEIKDCINRNCGATSIKGVKKRVRPGFGKCQGGFCESVVLKTLAQELGKKPTDINLSNDGSYIIFDREEGR